MEKYTTNIFHKGDEVKVKNIKKIKSKYIGKTGVIVKPEIIIDDAYTVSVDGTHLLLFAHEIDPVL